MKAVKEYLCGLPFEECTAGRLVNLEMVWRIRKEHVYLQDAQLPLSRSCFSDWTASKDAVQRPVDRAAVMILVRKQPKPKKTFIRLQSVIALVLFVGVMVNMICLNNLHNTLEVVLGDVDAITPETAAHSREVVQSVTSEGIVMLKNEAGRLPLSNTTNLNVFGWASTNPVYGGTGSGSVDASTAVDILQGLENAGFALNTELSDFYTAYRADRPAITINNGQDWTLPEPTAASYTAEMLNSAKSFSDTAVIVIARCGGEGADLPHNMGAVMDGSYNQGTKYTNASYTNNGRPLSVQQ